MAVNKKPRHLFLALALFSIGPVILGVYNWICFGAPWITSYTMSAQHQWSRTIWGTFSESSIEGLLFLLFNNGPIPESIVLRTGFPDHFLEYYHRQTFIGLFSYAPLLWLAIPGFVLALLQKNRRLMFTCFLLILFPTLLLMGAHRTPFGGSGFDFRYIFHVTPILFVGTAFFLGTVLRKIPAHKTFWAAALGMCVIILGIKPFFLNIKQIVIHTAQAMKACPNLIEGQKIPNILFPNLNYGSLTLFFLVGVWLLVFICREGIIRLWKFLTLEEK